jgi:ABC-2 type transport system permease protein
MTAMTTAKSTSELTALKVIARITWLRLLRGRSKWVSLLLAFLPVVFAALLTLFGADTDRSWDMVATYVLRLGAMLAVAVHLAPSVGEELESRTYTYLWSRPMPRRALLLGKLVATTPIAAAIFVVSVSATWLVVWQGDAGEHLGDLLSMLLATIGAVAAGSSLALVAGSFFPRHPLAVILGYVIMGDRLLGFIPALRQVSVYFHAISVAGVRDPMLLSATMTAGLVGLLVLTVGWLGLAIWRVERTEYALPDG